MTKIAETEAGTAASTTVDNPAETTVTTKVTVEIERPDRWELRHRLSYTMGVAIYKASLPADLREFADFDVLAFYGARQLVIDGYVKLVGGDWADRLRKEDIRNLPDRFVQYVILYVAMEYLVDRSKPFQ